MPAVGYTHPDQSHFTSRHYWEVGATDTQLQHRLARPLPRRRRHARQSAPGRLIRRHRSRPTLATAKVPVASISAPDQYDFWSHRVWGEVEDRMLEVDLGSSAAPVRRNTEVDRLRNQLLPVFSGRRDGQARLHEPGPVSAVERSVPGRLAGLAAMIAGGLPLRVVALSAPGEYDTHSDEPGALTAGLQLTSDSLLAFQRDLEARGIADRVLVHVWSEFGRRAQENGDQGPITAPPASASSSARAPRERWSASFQA